MRSLGTLVVVATLHAAKSASLVDADEALAFGASITHLNETNFEHLTQAATGATSGDWLVKFCHAAVPRCERFNTTWDKVAKQLAVSRESQGLPRINVAAVDSAESPRLVKRFVLNSFPAVLFFKAGVMYSFQGGSFSVERIAQFAERGYASSPRHRVPPEAHVATPHDQTFLLAIISVAVGAVLLGCIDNALQKHYRRCRKRVREERKARRAVEETKQE